MKLQHTDPKREAPKYCEAVCVLCGAAARMQLAQTHSTNLASMSMAIREMRASEFLEYAAQQPVVQAFLLLAGMPAIAPVNEKPDSERTPAGPGVTSAGGEEPGP